MKREPIRFRTTPRPGQTMMFDGQRYVLVAEHLHYRQSDGQPTIVLTWASHCAECGAPFETTTPLTVSYVTRRCLKHRKPGRPVARTWAAKTKPHKGGGR